MNTTLRQHTPWDDQIISMDGCSGSWRCLPAWAAPAAREGVLYFGSVRWAAGGPALHSCPGWLPALPALPGCLPRASRDFTSAAHRPLSSSQLQDAKKARPQRASPPTVALSEAATHPRGF